MPAGLDRRQFRDRKTAPRRYRRLLRPDRRGSGTTPPSARDLSPGRPMQKAEFGCEFFPNIVEAGSGEYFVEFFQRDRDGQRKGIVVIDLEEFEP